ncbi:hypothetical protein [Halococcus saccharolyticus]|uniref:Uncharacterized protein n=1 Tax=Halococcus saccharolyticus DSM 5350 TaxID=1227455 RepID=M0MQA6_9EURY|nr:hypothetical protein [Halococcus saccharolyticus]EMA47912.1 hypothetical protein C449_00530 [Halococcus saccharolyticus DSM 5350]
MVSDRRASVVDAVGSGASSVQAIDPTTVVDAPPARAIGAFVFVMLFGGVLLWRFDGFVDQSVDSSMERLTVSTVYGVTAHACVLFFGVYFFGQVTRLSANRLVVAGAGAAVAVAVVGLAGLGLTVVGARLTELVGERRPWYGLVVGAVLGASAWLLPAAAASLVVWVLLVSVGIGGPTREWIHASRAPATEADT